jgi:hypothetical protein
MLQVKMVRTANMGELKKQNQRCSIPTHSVATPVCWMGLLEANHPFIHYETLTL